MKLTWFPPKRKREDDNYYDIMMFVFLVPLVEEKKEARDIALSDFTEHVKSLHEDTNRGFEEEFSTISNPPFSTKTAELTQNREKNRFLNIMPCTLDILILFPRP